MGMDDTCDPNFVPFAMDEFESHLYLNYFNGFNSFLRIQLEFKCISADPLQINDSLH